ncbi:unnamed protein product [Medioppia subpectinata]|uniref:C2H2-type domain-containing protein n=1 Tax=Medioppia subpectinata TaxID=1979941 RepID=A0A7R9KUN7_9ACAR|nr:unnamed protein product [Medioppia subpectinata]CAG2109050.1 unnamed protein product [Medioppia subpectinata]
MSEESDESSVEELGEESDNSYVETKTYKPTKKYKWDKKYLRNHIQTHNTNKFVCDYTGCEKSFKSSAGLDDHRRRHAIEPTYKCTTDGCDKKFVNKFQRRKHEVAVHSRKPFVKPTRRCDWPGCDYEGIYLHKHILQHTGEKKFQCLWPECGKRFGRIDNFKYHMNIHNNVKPQTTLRVVKAIKQDIKKTSEKRITKTNVNQMNDKNEDISEESDESFAEELGEESDNSYVETKKRHLLRKHEMTAHSSDNPFKCEFNGCQYESRSTEYLRNHIQTHNTNKFVCDYTGCEKSFKSCGGLDLHRRGHAIEPTYKCNTDGCDEKFVNKWHRRKHEVAVHGRKPFVKPKRRCDWPGCDYEGIYLHKHILQHTGEKKFQCLWPECGKRFARVDYFKYHMNIHNNVKPYVCCWPGCTHSYANNANLHSHIKRFHTK